MTDTILHQPRDAIVADEYAARVMADAALVIANFRNRLTLSDAAHILRLKPCEVRGAVERGELAALDMSGSGSGDGKNRSLRFTYQDLAEWAKTYRRTS